MHLSLELLRVCRVTFRLIHEFRVNLKSPSQQPVRKAFVLFFALIPGQFTFVEIWERQLLTNTAVATWLPLAVLLLSKAKNICKNPNLKPWSPCYENEFWSHLDEVLMRNTHQRGNIISHNTGLLSIKSMPVCSLLFYHNPTSIFPGLSSPVGDGITQWKWG